MKLPRRQFLHLAAGAGAQLAVSRIAWAQAYPSRPVRLMVGFPPGGGADTTARIIAPWLSQRVGQPVVIENRPGASSTLAAQAVGQLAARRVKHAGSFPRGLAGCMVKSKTGQDPRLDRHRLHRGVSHGRRKETEQATRSRASGPA